LVIGIEMIFNGHYLSTAKAAVAYRTQGLTNFLRLHRSAREAGNRGTLAGDHNERKQLNGSELKKLQFILFRDCHEIVLRGSLHSKPQGMLSRCYEV
jgi:hypothetical protein